MAKKMLKITKNTVSSGIDQYTNVLFNRTKAVMRNAAATIMDQTAEDSPVDTRRLRNSFEQAGRAKQTLSMFKIPGLSDQLESARYPNLARIFGTNQVTKNFFGSNDTVAEFTYKPKDEISIKFGTRVPYARYPELGTSRQAPQLFFTNSLKTKKRDVLRYIKNNLTVR